MGRPERAAIMIAGAGIGGLTAAVALERRGHRIAVMERGDELSEAGAGITLWPNALAALDAIGLGAAIRQAGAAVVSGGIRTPEGSWLRRFNGRRLTAALGEALVVISRGELLATLASTLDPATITFGVAVDSYGPGRDDTVQGRLSGGTVIAAWGRIGADGTGSSVVRQLLRYRPIRAG